MHINMKYYIVSIGAIFISLGIGVLVGFNINDNQLLYDQQAGIITDLEEEFDKFKTLNKELEDNLALTNANYEKTLEFIKLNFSEIISDKLVDKNIGIISTNEKNKYTQNIAGLVKDAGGNVSFDIVIDSSIQNEETLKTVSELIGKEIKTSDDIVKYIGNLLNDETGKSKLEELEENNIIKINSIDEAYTNYSEVVLAGGSDGKVGTESFEKIDLNLINTLKENEKSIVGIQQSTSKINYSDLYFEQKISSIDNMDDVLGELSLVLLLQNSNILGQFGMLENAESIIPYNAISKEN